MKALKLVVIMAVGYGTACMMIGSKAHFMRDGASKAAFDMQCDKEKLDITELKAGSMGVRGCGKQGRYEFVQGAGWVLNSAENNDKK